MIGLISIILTSTVAGTVAGWLVGSIIEESSIRDKLKNDNAFYGKIIELQPKTVTIEEMDEYNNKIQSFQLQSDGGVSDELFEGQIIYA